MRQRISALEDRVALLSKLTTAVAGVTRTLSEPENVVVENENENENESNDEAEYESESDSESEPNVSVPIHLLMDEFPRMAHSMMCEDTLTCMILEEPLNLVISEPVTITEVESSPAIEIEEVDTELPKRKVSSDDVKTLSVEINYESLSVKELKDKVAEMNGPKLKTKKELLEFLKNKM
jgi:hypothetical protein